MVGSTNAYSNSVSANVKNNRGSNRKTTDNHLKNLYKNTLNHSKVANSSAYGNKSKPVIGKYYYYDTTGKGDKRYKKAKLISINRREIGEYSQSGNYYTYHKNCYILQLPDGRNIEIMNNIYVPIGMQSY